MTLEKLAKQIYDECLVDGEPVTEEEALDMAKMELGSKEVSRQARAEEPKKERKPKTVKTSEEKMEVFCEICRAFKDFQSFKVDKPYKMVSFTVNGHEFSVDLIEHRKKSLK